MTNSDIYHPPFPENNKTDQFQAGFTTGLPPPKVTRYRWRINASRLSGIYWYLLIQIAVRIFIYNLTYDIFLARVF